jgi:very-short-patch-repair endonuclease
MRYQPYNKNLKGYSRDLRNHSTSGEVLLWKQLRNRCMMGYLFNRQKPLKNYIVDFYCASLKLVIEADGEYHNHDEDWVNDETRQQILEEMGLNFLRFPEKQIREDMVSVLFTIENYIVSHEEKCPEVKGKAMRKSK